MYRVAINRLCTFGAKTGIGHYTAQLLSHVQRRSPADMRVRPFPSGTACVVGAIALKARQVLKGIGGYGLSRVLGPYQSAFWQQASALSQRAKKTARRALAAQLAAYDLYHEPNYLPFDSDVPKIVTIHDLSVFLYPQWHPAARVAAFEKGFRKMLGEASHFITDAECVRAEFIERFSISQGKVTCVYPGIGERFAPASSRRTARALKKLGLEPGYFLSVGAIEPRKNLHLAMQAYCDLPAAMRERHPFVLAGPWGWNWKEVREYFDAEASRRGVRHLGYVPDGALPDLYRGAKALVFPSFYEGFGLPPLEMAACGGAVLASDIPPLRETLGRRALFVSPFDRDGWRQAMHDAIADDSLLDPFRREGPSIREQFSWAVAAANFRDAYRGVLDTLKLPRRRAA